MTEDRKPVTGKSAEDALYALPYVVGKMCGARMIGLHLVENDKKFNETKKFSNEFLEFIKAAMRSINFLSGFYDAIEEVFGEGYGKEMFERVIGAHTNSKANRKLRDQVRLLRQYFADPKNNASKVAREAARNDDNLAASKLRNLNRWRKNQKVAGLAKIDLMLGVNTIDSKGQPPTIGEIRKYLIDNGQAASLGHFFQKLS
jgi:hypothetical protein